VEACPFDAITMWTGNYEIGAFNRLGLVYDMPTLHADHFYPTPDTPALAAKPAPPPEPAAPVAAPAP
jgi:hypothetical protein